MQSTLNHFIVQFELKTQLLITSQRNNFQPSSGWSCTLMSVTSDYYKPSLPRDCVRKKAERRVTKLWTRKIAYFGPESHQNHQFLLGAAFKTMQIEKGSVVSKDCSKVLHWSIPMQKLRSGQKYAELTARFISKVPWHSYAVGCCLYS